MIQIGRFTFGKYKNGKRFWAYNGRDLVMPHLMVWRLFWHIPVLVCGILMYILLWIQRGKYAADEFWGIL